MASKMASTYIFVFTISLQLFNRFSSNFTKNLEIYFQLIGICYNFIMSENKMASKWHLHRYVCLLYLFNRSTDFHQIFTKNVEIYFQHIGMCYNFNIAENKMASKMAST